MECRGWKDLKQDHKEKKHVHLGRQIKNPNSKSAESSNLLL
jgi:hypothetical protein